MWCEICGVETYEPFHHCAPARLRRRERAYAREEIAAEDYDTREEVDPLRDGFLMLGLTEEN